MTKMIQAQLHNNLYLIVVSHVNIKLLIKSLTLSLPSVIKLIECVICVIKA